jgi:predicted dehydrogenase
MRCALIGCGVIGRIHAAAIAALTPEIALVMAVGRDLASAQAIASEYGATPVQSAEDALTSPDVDAVAICTPSGTHSRLAIAAMNAGKDVIVEKPLDVTLEAARQVAAAQHATERTLTVISQHRFDPASQVVYDAVQEGHLGRLTSGVASIPWWRDQDYYDSGKWRGTWALDGGGAIMNQGIHTIDLLIWMLGEPREVFGWTGCLAHQDIEVEDTAVATIRFANGALGVIHGTTAAYPGHATRLQIHGDQGSAIIDGDELTSLQTSSHNKDTREDGQIDANRAEYSPESQQSRAHAVPAALSLASHIKQYRDFVDAVKNHRQPLVTADDGIRSIATIDALYRSARHGQPVPIELNPSLSAPTAIEHN